MPMSRYYFNVLHDGVNLDGEEEALEFDSLAAAEHAAALTASELGMDRVRKGNAAGHEVVVEVRDEQQQRIAMVTAGMRIERLASAGSEQDRYGHPK
jgi:hypothetical protein